MLIWVISNRYLLIREVNSYVILKNTLVPEHVQTSELLSTSSSLFASSVADASF